MIKITKCRICDNTNLIPLVNLGNQYLTGVFPKSRTLESPSQGPLELVKCHGDEKAVCGLVQLHHNFNLDEMYGDNYGYRSGLNGSMVNHLKDLSSKICDFLEFVKDDLIIDIGSNDGTLLSFYPKNMNLIGIDPTANRFREYYNKEVNIISEFFSSNAIKNVVSAKKAKIITSIAMFYDLEKPLDFVNQINDVLDEKEGIWVFEQSYMPLMLKYLAYDTICHEHLEYYSINQIKWILEKANMQIIKVELTDTNGGSFLVFASSKKSNYRIDNKSIDVLYKMESELEINNLFTYKKFNNNIQLSKEILLNFIDVEKRRSKRICGLGASTKGNVILQYCKLNDKDIESIGEVNPDKYGSFTPGSLIPIISEKELLDSRPENIIILPWHFRNFFLSSKIMKNQKLVFPLPKFEIIQN